MTMNERSTASMPLGLDADGLVKVGFIVQTAASQGKLRHLSMVELVDLLSRKSSDELNTILSPVLKPIGRLPVEVIHSLHSTLPTLGSDTATVEMSTFLAVFTALGIVAVILRFAARRKAPNAISTDDWTALVALLFSLLFSAISLTAFLVGHAGTHLWHLSLNQIRVFALSVFVQQIVFNICFFLICSIFLALYWRLSQRREFRYFVVAAGVLIGLVVLAGILVTIFQCTPVNQWDDLMNARCIDRVTASTVIGALYVACEFLVLALPVPYLLKSKLGGKQMTLTVVLYMFGILVCAISCARVFFVRRWISSTDFTYQFNEVAPWTTLEIYLPLILSCVPAFYQALSKTPPSASNERVAHGHANSNRLSRSSNQLGSQNSKASKDSRGAMSARKVRSILGSIKRERRDSAAPIALRPLEITGLDGIGGDLVLEGSPVIDGTGPPGVVGQWHDFTDEAERRPVKSRDGTYEMGARSRSNTVGSRSRSGTAGNRSRSGTVRSAREVRDGEMV